MAAKEKIVLSWSGGKDSAMALHELQRSGQWDVVSLLTTVAKQFERVSHHGVRTELLERQADALGVPLHKIYLAGTMSTNEEYEAIMEEAMLDYKRTGVEAVAFGDLFLEDLRDYRIRNLAKVGMRAVFPIWGRDTAELVRSFCALGFKARLTCVVAESLSADFVGRLIDEDLVRDLPPNVDPCGENGEFHSFVFDGPCFKWPVNVRLGETVKRDVRYFADLLPDQPA